MGWTSYHATYYKPNGDIDRKKECDAYFLEGLNRGYYRIVKSAMHGSVYYAAVQQLKKLTTLADGSTKEVPVTNAPIWAMVILTSTASAEYFNFSYKEMSEDVGPCYYDCPESILKLLSETDSEWANAWRKKCKEHTAKKKFLRTCPFGTTIEFERENGECIRLFKHPAAYQFRKPFWMYVDANKYCPTNHIPDAFRVVTK